MGVALYDWESHADHSAVTHDQVQRVLNPFSVTALRSPDPFSDRFPSITRYLFSGQYFPFTQDAFFSLSVGDAFSMLPLFKKLDNKFCRGQQADPEQRSEIADDAEFQFRSLFWCLTEAKICFFITFVDGLFVLETDSGIAFFDSLYALFVFAECVSKKRTRSDGYSWRLIDELRVQRLTTE